MKTFKITFGNGSAWAEVHHVQVEDFEHEQDAVDKLIDKFERTDCTGFLLTQDDMDSGEYYSDEYVVGGNHGLGLHHYGLFRIEEVKSA